jgi:hypothetical protein
LIIGNAPNKLGEFSYVAVPLASLKLFGCITQKDKVNAMMPYESNFENNALVSTDWHDSGTTYVGLLLPNGFILYFGQKQKPPIRDVTSDDVKMAFPKVGTGYKTWCTFAEEDINSSLKIATVLSNAAAEVDCNHAAFVKNYFSKRWAGNGIKLTSDGPATPIMLVPSDTSPAEANEIKRTSWHKIRPTLGIQALVHSPSNIRANWGRKPKPKNVWPNSCSYASKLPWT